MNVKVTFTTNFEKHWIQEKTSLVTTYQIYIMAQKLVKTFFCA